MSIGIHYGHRCRLVYIMDIDVDWYTIWTYMSIGIHYGHRCRLVYTMDIDVDWYTIWT